MDVESIFDNNQPAIEPVEQPVEAVEPAPVAEPPVEAVVPPVEAPPVVEPVKEDRSVPLATFLDMRDQANDLKRRNAEMEARLAKPEPAAIPDPLDDPHGFAAAQQAQFQGALMQERFRMSAEMAKQQFGADKVDEARKWAIERAEKDPAFDLAMGQQAHPLAWVVQQHQRDATISQIGDRDLDTFVKDYVAKNPDKFGLIAPAAVAAPTATMVQPAPTPVAPPRSLAAAPSTGGGVKDIPVGPMVAMESVFK